MIEYASNLEEFQTIFEHMGFVRDTSAESTLMYFPAAGNYEPGDVGGYIILDWYYSSHNAYPITYYSTNGGSITAITDMIQSAGYSIKVEYYKLYGGGVIFRACSSASANIVNASFSRMLNFAIFPLNDGDNWNIIFNTGTNATTSEPYLDSLDGTVGQFPHWIVERAVQSNNVSSLTRIYNNRNDIVDAEVYLDVVPHVNTIDTLFTQVDGVNYVLGFGVSNAQKLRYAFRLADES